MMVPIVADRPLGTPSYKCAGKASVDVERDDA